MPTVSVSDQTFKRLAEKAAALNISVEEMIAPALDQLAAAGRTNGETSPATPEDRKRAFEEWTRLIESRADRYAPGHVLDDSRESLYREREDSQL